MESLRMAVQVVVPMAMMVGIGVLLRIFKVMDQATMGMVSLKIRLSTFFMVA